MIKQQTGRTTDNWATNQLGNRCLADLRQLDVNRYGIIGNIMAKANDV